VQKHNPNAFRSDARIVMATAFWSISSDTSLPSMLPCLGVTDPRLKTRAAGAQAQVKSGLGSGTLFGRSIHPDHKASVAYMQLIDPRFAGIIQV
jgi:hypothetical protein